MVKAHVTKGKITMEEKNELNDIILNKGGASSGSKKLLLAIATLTLILIIVLVIMNSLKNDEVQKAPQAILPPEPTAPTEVINDPLFEPVEVIQEGNTTAGEQDLDKLAQKIKEESLQETPVAAAPVSSTPAPVAAAPMTPKTVQQVPAVAPKPVVTETKKVVEPKIVKTPKSEPVKVQAPTIKQEPKKVVQSKPAAKAVSETKTEPKAEVKTEPKTETKAPAATSGATYYIQVGSFTKEPNKALYDRLNASGMKFTTQKSGETTKILVGPFQGEKAVQDAMGNVRQNIEAKAFRIKG